MKGRTRPPPNSLGSTAGACRFAVSVDRDAAQIMLRGRPTGAGGGATLAPAPGVELVFDRVGGWLSCMIVEAGEPGGAVAAGERVVRYLASVFGSEAAAAVREAYSREVQSLALRARPGTIGALSRLARLDAACATSPVPTSPLWAAEAADLARQAALPDRTGERWAPVTSPNELGSTIPAEVLARSTAVGGPGLPAEPGPFAYARHLARPGMEAEPGHGGRPLGGWLDLGLVPSRVFRPGLWPESDLGLRAYRDGAPLIAVEAVVLPGAAPEDLAGCRARLVDGDARRVLATAAFMVGAPLRMGMSSHAGSPLRAWAELPDLARPGARARPGAACVEVVCDERRPVHGTRLRRIRRALRWADAALRAESRPNGLAPEFSDEQWARLAGLAWDRCRADWEAAGDPGRASLAEARGAALRTAPRATLRGGATLCGWPGDGPGAAEVRRARPFLAELVCGPAVTQ